MHGSDELLEISHVTVKYGAARVLDDVSLSIRRGEIVSLVGANGAGKSTLLKSASGMVPIAAGGILFRGSQIGLLPTHKLVGMGISHIPERRELFPDLTVSENLEMGAYLQKDRRQLEKTRGWCFELFPILKERLNQGAGTLSGGEQQMLAIARGLMSNPRLLLLDEPSLGLAPKYVDDIFDIILSVNAEGVTILLVEQNARKALLISKRGYVLENGRVAAEGVSADLIKSQIVKEAYLGG